jgi:soluble lytic murein transglycosylase-like protein
LTAQGNPSVLKDAKDMIVNVAIGFVIVLSAWLLIDLMMKSLLGGPTDTPIRPWSQIACVEQPESEVLPAFVGFPTPNGSRGTAYDTGAGIDPTILAGIANLSADEADAAIVVAAAQAGLSADQVRNMQALMRVESGGCRNNVSPVGALGCMQIMPNTAREYDPALRGLSDQAVRERLLDRSYNISLGVQIYADLYDHFAGDTTKVFAGYNGGRGAVDPSRDCPATGSLPALARYQCVWDSPGCYGTSRTDCVPNTGYIETRNYVEKVARVAREL